MSYIALPHNIANPHVLTAAEVNENFAAISSEVNGNLDGTNVSPDAELEIASLTASQVTCDKWDISRLCTIKLPSTDGSHRVVFKDYQGNVLFAVYSDGRVVIG